MTRTLNTDLASATKNYEAARHLLNESIDDAQLVQLTPTAGHRWNVCMPLLDGDGEIRHYYRPSVHVALRDALESVDELSVLQTELSITWMEWRIAVKSEIAALDHRAELVTYWLEKKTQLEVMTARVENTARLLAERGDVRLGRAA